MKVDILKKFQGCLAGLMIGDAMGQPVETMTPGEILAATGGAGITGFVDPIQTRFKQLMSFQAGDYTDDWQLTRALATSLIRMGKFDITDIARTHVDEMRLTTAGWGGTTKRAVRELAEYFDSKGAQGRSPLTPVDDFGTGKGAGNGVAMKIAPLALWHYHQRSSPIALIDDSRQLGKLTHDKDEAWLTAYALALYIGYSLEQSPTSLSINDLTSVVTDDIRRIETAIEQPRLVTDKLKLIYGLKNLAESNTRYNVTELARWTGTDCHCLQSAPFAIGVYCLFPTDFRTGVLAAVNAGGDTDSNAAMVGAMIGANVGIDGIPREWIEFRPHFQEAIDLATELYDRSTAHE